MTTNSKYFSPGQIFLAGIIGGLPAGLYLYRHNAFLFGKRKDGNTVFLIGVGLTALGMGLYAFGESPLTHSIARSFGPASAILPFIVTRQIQAVDLKRYQEAGGQKAAGAKALGVGLISLLVILAAVFLTVWVSQKYSSR